MTYVKSYFKALFKMILTAAFIFLLISAFANNAFAAYSVFLCLTASMAGPLSLLINNKETVQEERKAS